MRKLELFEVRRQIKSEKKQRQAQLNASGLKQTVRSYNYYNLPIPEEYFAMLSYRQQATLVHYKPDFYGKFTHLYQPGRGNMRHDCNQCGGSYIGRRFDHHLITKRHKDAVAKPSDEGAKRD